MAEEILEHLEFLHRELESPPGPHNLASHEVHRQSSCCSLRPDPGGRGAGGHGFASSSGNAKGLTRWSSAPLSSRDPIIDGVLGGQDQDGRLEGLLAERGENLEAVAARQHEIEDHKIERLVVHEEKSFFARARDTDLVVLGLEPITKGFCDLLFVLDDQDTHGTRSISTVQGRRT
jgi:hypothetical protein